MIGSFVKFSSAEWQTGQSLTGSVCEKDANLIFNYGSEFGRLGEPCVMHSRCQVSTNFREWRLRFRWTSASMRSRVDQCSLLFSRSENCVSLTIQHFQFVKRATYSSKQRHRANMFMRPTFGEDCRRFHLTCFSDRFACCRLSISSHTVAVPGVGFLCFVY